jgi:hypothetical protein
VWPVELVVLLINNKQKIGDKLSHTSVLRNLHQLLKMLRIVIVLFIMLSFFIFVNKFGEAIITDSEAYKIAATHIQTNTAILIEIGEFESF